LVEKKSSTALSKVSLWLEISLISSWESKGPNPPGCHPCQEIAGLIKRFIDQHAPYYFLDTVDGSEIPRPTA